MSHHDNDAYLLDIRQAAVQHQIMIIGEASKHLSTSFRTEHRQIPWNAIARMRDRLIHGYSTVDMNVVWTTATESIPELLHAVDHCLTAE